MRFKDNIWEADSASIESLFSKKNLHYMWWMFTLNMHGLNLYYMRWMFTLNIHGLNAFIEIINESNRKLSKLRNNQGR